MILGAREIHRLINEKQLFVDPLFEDTVRENGLDLRIGGEYAIYAYDRTVVKPCELDDQEAKKLFRVVKNVDEVVIPPNSFVLLTTFEYIKLPNDVVGLANLRSTLARYGLSLPPTVVDSGFEGNVTIEVINNSANTIVLKKFTRFLHLVLVRADDTIPYMGTYRGQVGVTPPKGLKHEC